jgi:signal transduction histidine kinase
LLIDELMDVSRVSTGELTVNLMPLDFDVLVEQVANAAAPTATSRRLDLAVNIQDRPTVIAGDALRLHQIVENLLSNAIKFTPDGGRITLSLSSRDGYATFEVADTGIGMEADLLEHVFEPFWQARRSSSAYRGGLGLGLPIVRRLVHLHGGTIRALSEGQGLGSRFVVRFELAPNGHNVSHDRRRGERRGFTLK